MTARRRRGGALAAVATLLALPLSAGCRAGTVELAFAPEVGDRYEHRYVVDATVTQALDDVAPTVHRLHSTLDVRQEVVEVTGDVVLVELTLRRDGGPRRTSQVRLDRAGVLEGIDLIEGQTVDVFGLDVLGGLLTGTPLPDEPVGPGDRWPVELGSVRGSARLVRLGIVDGRDVAVVRTSLEQAVDEVVPTATTTAGMRGTLRSSATTTYDLADGSLRRASTRARGAVRVRVAPPPGIVADPALGTITYDVRVEVARTA